jgi:hypothetical protein
MPASESLLLLLMLCRFGQGVGLGGEWGGAVLLSRTLRQACLVRYVSQLGAPIGLLLSGGTLDFNGYDEFPRFSGLWLEDSFIASSLVVVGFYIRLK